MTLAPDFVAYSTAATAASSFTPSASATLQVIMVVFQQTPAMPIIKGVLVEAPMIPAT